MATGVLLLHGDLHASGGPEPCVRHHRDGRSQHRLHRRLRKSHVFIWPTITLDEEPKEGYDTVAMILTTMPHMWLSSGLLQGHGLWWKVWFLQKVLKTWHERKHDTPWTEQMALASMLALSWVCVLVADLSCGALISPQCTTGLQPHPPDSTWARWGQLSQPAPKHTHSHSHVSNKLKGNKEKTKTNRGLECTLDSWWVNKAELT